MEYWNIGFKCIPPSLHYPIIPLFHHSCFPLTFRTAVCISFRCCTSYNSAPDFLSWICRRGQLESNDPSSVPWLGIFHRSDGTHRSHASASTTGWRAARVLFAARGAFVLH